VTFESMWRTPMRAGFFTPTGLLVRAALLAGSYLILSAAGLREFTGALSFTTPAGVPAPIAAIGCAAYLVFYFSWVLVVPVLVIAAALLAVVNRSGRKPPELVSFSGSPTPAIRAATPRASSSATKERASGHPSALRYQTKVGVDPSTRAPTGHMDTAAKARARSVLAPR
jgi:hypothetical protein